MIAETVCSHSPGLSPDNFRFLQSKIHQLSGIVIEPQKQYLLEARLSPMVNRLQLKSLDDLSALVRRAPDSALVTEIIESMTTHESYFFRDQPQFDCVRIDLLPSLLMSRMAKRKITFWSAAASCGQEAYTLAMALREMNMKGWGIEILATDLSERILNRARSAVYSGHELTRDKVPAVFEKYLIPENGKWRITDEIRQMVEFRKFDLRGDPRALGCFDVVFCRNVLIYFDAPTRQRVLDGIADVLPRDGALFLGGGETTLGCSERFARKTACGAVYYQLAKPAKT